MLARYKDTQMLLPRRRCRCWSVAAFNGDRTSSKRTNSPPPLDNIINIWQIMMTAYYDYTVQT